MTGSNKSQSGSEATPVHELRVGRPTPITIEHVRQDMADHIAHVLTRHSMYFGPPSLRAIDPIEAVVWHLFVAWSSIDHRHYEFHDVWREMTVASGLVEEPIESRTRGVSWEEAFRKVKPDATDEEVFEFVVRQLSGVAEKMGISLLNEPQ